MAGILWAVIVVLFALWLIGLVAHVGGFFIHILLVAAIIMIAYNVLTKGKVAL